MIRSGRREGFTVLYNTMITDKRLSLKAKGLFAVMMSRPDGWKFSVSGLAAFTGSGKDAIRSALKELECVGYLLRDQDHKDDGTFGGNVYILQDFAPPLSGKPDNGEIPLSGNAVDGENRQRETPLSGNPTQRNKDLKKRKTEEPPVSPKGDAGGAKRKKRGGLETAPEVWAAAQAYAGEDQELLAALTDFLWCREKRKNPMLTERSINTLLAKLGRLAPDRAMKVLLLDYATSHNWDSVYPMKPEELEQFKRKSEEPAGNAPRYVRTDIIDGREVDIYA